MDQKILEVLKNNNIDFEAFEHEAIFTVEQSKKIESHLPWEHTKNLFLKDRKQNFYLVCVQADKKLDIKTFWREKNLKDLSFWNESQLFENLKVLPWSVNLFSAIHWKNIKVFIDQDLWWKKVGWHPWVNTATLVLDFQNLKKFLESENIDFEIVSIPEKLQ